MVGDKFGISSLICSGYCLAEPEAGVDGALAGAASYAGASVAGAEDAAPGV